jgi:uncharacterized membrane protein YbhN (UPF0104 family)
MTGVPPLLGAGRASAAGPLLFASTPHDPRARRPTDIALAIVSFLGLLIASVVAEIAADLDESLAGFLGRFPPFLDPMWRAMAWAPLAWAVVLLVAAVLRRRPALARDILASVVVAMTGAVILAAIVTDDAWAPLRQAADLDGPPSFPPGSITIAAAALATASPHLSRPFRHFGRWLLAAQFVGVLFLGVARLGGATVGIFVGLLAAALVHLVVGSPGGRPTRSRIELALADLGLEAVSLAPATMQAEGVLRFEGRDHAGPIEVKVYGRDAWDAQLLANAWRLAWYRGSERTARLSRLELVEHEGFVTLLAERAGVRVPHVVTAGNAGQGDALVVVRPEGQPIGARVGDIADTTLDGLWSELHLLHDAGIAHRRLELDRVRVSADGSVGFGDLSSASVVDSPSDRHQDEAQAMALTLVLAGEERAVAAAQRSLGDEALLAMLPYFQGAALPVTVRDALDKAGVDVDDVRNRVRTALGAEEQQLIRLRRVTAGSVLNILLLAIAAYALIGAFSDMDLDTFFEELRDASWWWLAFALVLAQIPRIPAAWSTMGSVQGAIPLGPATALQFAICYVNLAIPSTAARVAINVRFFQRFGIRPTAAMTAGAIDSVSGFIVQIVLFLVLFFGSDLNLELSTDTSEMSGLATIVLIVLIAVVVGVAAILIVAPLRRRVVGILRQAKSALSVLRSPRKLLQLFGGNLLSQVLFAVAFATCVEAFHQTVPLSELLLINTVVSLFAGLLPVPGGIGVSEAGLTLGLTAAGLPSETAFGIALAYRFTSFYLPPIWGWFCYQWLIKRRYL